MKAVFNPALHGLRGVASMMVFLAHLVDGFARHFFFDHPVVSTVVPAFTQAMVFGVEVFFLISGYVIAGSCLKYSATEFALRRLVRLYPVFLVLTIVYFVANAFIKHEPHKLNIDYLLINLAFFDFWLQTPTMTPNAWSISCEVWYYVFAYVGISYFVKGAWQRRSETAVLFIAAVAILVVFAPITLYFVIGVCVYAFERGTLAPVRKTPLSATTELLLLASLAVAAAAFQRSSHLYAPSDLASPIGVLMVTSAALIFLQIARGGSVLDRMLRHPFVLYLGTISYSLYLAHPYTYFAMRKLLAVLGLSALPMPVAFAIYMTAMLGAGLAFAHLVHVTLEVQPYRYFFGSSIYEGKVRRIAQSGRPVVAGTDRP